MKHLRWPAAWPLLFLLAFPLTSGCFSSNPEEQGIAIPKPRSFDLPPADGSGIREPRGVWFHEGRIDTWALFLQELPSDLSPEIDATFDASFEPERPLGADDVVFLSEPFFASARQEGRLRLQFIWAKVAVGAGSSVAHVGPVQSGFDGDRWFLASYIATSVPGTLRLGIDFGETGAAGWDTPFRGDEEMKRMAATLRPGDEPASLSLQTIPGSAVILFLGDDKSNGRAWQNISVGDTMPFRHEHEGTRRGASSTGMVSAAGWLTYPHSSVTATAQYDGPAAANRAVLAAIPSRLADDVFRHYGVALESHLLGKGYDGPVEGATAEEEPPWRR